MVLEITDYFSKKCPFIQAKGKPQVLAHPSKSDPPKSINEMNPQPFPRASTNSNNANRNSSVLLK